MKRLRSVTLFIQRSKCRIENGIFFLAAIFRRRFHNARRSRYQRQRQVEPMVVQRVSLFVLAISKWKQTLPAPALIV